MGIDWGKIAGDSIPLIGGTISGLSDANKQKKNRKWQEEQNRLDRQFQRDMYEWSRWDAKSDWEREAAYNSPVEQMNRLRQAGLNPNLVYGKGADNTMSSVRSGQMTGGSQPAPQEKTTVFGDALTKYYQLQNIQANTDNLAQNVALSKEEALVKQATVAKMGIDTARSDFELSQAKALKDMVIKQAMLANQKTATEINTMEGDFLIRLRDEGRRRDLHPSNMAAIEQQIKNARLDGRLKEAEERLRAKGINPNDPTYVRMLAQMILDPKYFKELFK